MRTAHSRLGRNDLSGGGLEELALSPRRFNGLLGRFSEGVRLHSNSFGREVLPSHHHLVNPLLGLGHRPSLKEGVEANG